MKTYIHFSETFYFLGQLNTLNSTNYEWMKDLFDAPSSWCAFTFGGKCNITISKDIRSSSNLHKKQMQFTIFSFY